jgi:2'-5' RNA ligase
MGGMSDLFSGDDGGGPPNGASRGERELFGAVYFALKPEPDAVSQAVSTGRRLSVAHGLAGEVSPKALHVSVCPVGLLPDLSDGRVEAACKAASQLVAKPFEIGFDRVRTYPTEQARRPLVAFNADGSRQAALFRQALVKDLRRSGFAVRSGLPRLHMTLFYAGGVVADEPIDPIRWSVRDFALIHSIWGEGRHVLLGQWPLRG